jgi:RES domain-containing protein
MSGELTTAVAEYEQDLGIRPGTFCAYDVGAEGVINLCDNAVLSDYDIEPADRFCTWKSTLLVCNQRPVTWEIFDRLIADGIAGVLVPSARAAGGTNLALWHWNDSPHRTVRVLDPLRDLPNHQPL